MFVRWRDVRPWLVVHSASGWDCRSARPDVLTHREALHRPQQADDYGDPGARMDLVATCAMPGSLRSTWRRRRGIAGGVSTSVDRRITLLASWIADTLDTEIQDSSLPQGGHQSIRGCELELLDSVGIVQVVGRTAAHHGDTVASDRLAVLQHQLYREGPVPGGPDADEYV